MPGGLTSRVIAASTLLALLIASTFLFLRAAVRDEANASAVIRRIRVEMAEADELQRQLIELDSDVRGYAATGDPSFVATWEARRQRFSTQITELADFVGDERASARVARIGTSAERYVDETLRPVIGAVQAGAPAAEVGRLLGPDERRSALLDLFDDYEAAETELMADRTARSDAATDRAAAAAVVGVAGSIALIGSFGAFLVRSVLRPLRRATDMADQLAQGDLAVRLPETGPGEIGQLERSFNTMGAALESGRDRLVGLAEEHAALRRVASLVATGARPTEVFDAVVGEVERLMGSDATGLLRFQHPQLATMTASRQHVPGGRPDGTTWSYDGDELIESFAEESRTPHSGSIETLRGPTADLLRSRGLKTVTGAPIIVEGQIWGAVVASWLVEVQDPVALGRQIAELTELAGTAIANAHSRDELAASRARILVAADDARRRIERDLHDGAQQRLLSLGVELRLAEMSLPEDPVSAKADLARINDSLSEAAEALQEISRGVHPAILSHGGLTPALKGLVRRSSVPAAFVSHGEHHASQSVEIAAYFFVSEALTNVAKHAGASSVTVEVVTTGDLLCISVRDNGVGGADPAAGSGLIGLRDRIEAVGGTLVIASRFGGGTTLTAKMPANL